MPSSILPSQGIDSDCLSVLKACDQYLEELCSLPAVLLIANEKFVMLVNFIKNSGGLRKCDLRFLVEHLKGQLEYEEVRLCW